MVQTKNVHLLGDHGKDSRGTVVAEDPKLTTQASGRTSTVTRTVQVHAALFVMQLGFAGHQVLSRVALTSGLSQFVYAVYRNGIALVLMGPFAYALEKKDRPPITPRLLFRFFMLGLTGIVGSQQLFLAGLIYTSATFAATLQNAVPVITFLMALMLGLEKVQLRRLDGQAKVVGTVVCVAGAVLMSAWKGPALIKGWNEEDPGPGEDDLQVKALLGQMLGSHALRLGIDKWRLGGILLLINCVSWAAYLIMQAPLLKVCPTPLTITAFTYFFGSIQVGVIMLIFTGGKIDWSLSWGPQVISVLYAGVISSGINFSLQSWAIQKGGPLLVSLYTPVQSIIVAILSVVLLGDSLYLGSTIGGIGAVAGLYLVTWGQVEHRKRDAIEAAAANGDVEAAIEGPQFDSSASDLTQPLLGGGEVSQEEHQQQSRPQVAVQRAPLTIPRFQRQPSFYYDEQSASFSPHHVH